MPQIIGVGESDVDIFLKIRKMPGKGEKTRAVEIGKLPGGIIGNFCAGVAKHGVSCGIVSVVGDDAYGTIALDDYQDRGIDTTNLLVKEGKPTFYCVVFVDESGEKYLTAVESPLISPEHKDIDFEYLRTAQFVHMCSMDYELAKFVSQGLAGTNTKVSMDYEAHAQNGGYEQWKPIFQNTRILFINEDGMNSLFENLSLDKGAEKLLSTGIEMVILTMGEQGGRVYTGKTSRAYKAFKVHKVVDTTGAGDCFNAAFLSGIVQGKDLEENMRYAAAASALSIQKLGARTGLPTPQEIQMFLESNPELIII